MEAFDEEREWPEICPEAEAEAEAYAMSRKAWSKGRDDMAGGGLGRSIEAEGNVKSKGMSTDRLESMLETLHNSLFCWLTYEDMMLDVY